LPPIINSNTKSKIPNKVNQALLIAFTIIAM
jgi:hypothetical protein